MSIKVLLIGSSVDRNFIRLVNNLVKNNFSDDLTIDIFHTNPPLHNKLSGRLTELTPRIRKFISISNTNINNRFLARIVFLLKFICQVIRIKNNEYDLVNIHYMSGNFFFVMDILKKKTKKILITPWGSDVYKVKGINFLLIKLAYKKANYISFGSFKFKKDISKIFKVPENKFIELCFGSEIIDLINNHSEITKECSKKLLGISGLVIVCGYNASPNQQHIEIINAFNKIKHKLPPNSLLVFPMTYAKNVKYTNYIKDKLKETNLNYKIYEDFLTDIELTYLRKCADIFIHVQKTDAFSATVQEYLLSDTTVINGSWLEYSDLEKWGIPYIKVNNFDELSIILEKIINNECRIKIKDELKKDILSRGYANQATKWIDCYQFISEN